MRIQVFITYPVGGFTKFEKSCGIFEVKLTVVRGSDLLLVISPGLCAWFNSLVRVFHLFQSLSTSCDWPIDCVTQRDKGWGWTGRSQAPVTQWRGSRVSSALGFRLHALLHLRPTAQSHSTPDPSDSAQANVTLAIPPNPHKRSNDVESRSHVSLPLLVAFQVSFRCPDHPIRC